MFVGVLSQSQKITAIQAASISRVDLVISNEVRSGVWNQAFNNVLNEGDLVFVFSASFSGGSSNPPSVSGYTELIRLLSGNNRYVISYKFMSSTPDTFATLTPAESGLHGTVITAYRNVDIVSPIAVSDLNNAIPNPEGAAGYHKAAIASGISGGLLLDFAMTYTSTDVANWYNDDGKTSNVALLRQLNIGLGGATGKSIGLWERFDSLPSEDSRLYKHLHPNDFGLNYSTLLLRPA